MPQRRFNISNEELIRLYTTEHLTGKEIGNRFGVTAATVYHRLKWLGIKSSQGELVDLVCDFCGKFYLRTRARARKEGSKYCSQNCYFAKRSNPKYVQSRQGQRIARAIVGLYFPLQSEHVVHHKDGDTRHNDLRNLQVFASHSDHLIYHHGRRKILPQPIWDGAAVRRLRTQ